MLERIVKLLGDESKFAEECVFRYRVRLSHNEVVSIREAVKCIL